MKQYKNYLIGFATLGLLISFALYYVDHVNKKRQEYQTNIYKTEAEAMKKRVASIILSKQKATISIGLSLANDATLEKYILAGTIPDTYYENVINKYKKDTLYKNIWIQILDKNLSSLYRSWSPQKNDNVKMVREDLVTVLKTKETTYAISSGKYDLSIKAMVPLIKYGEVIGIIEIVSHFNSISKQMKYFNIDSLVLLEKNRSKKLQYPFTNIFTDGYYVANFDAPKDILKYIEVEGVEKYITDTYILKDDFLVTSLKLKCVHGETIGYYVMFKKLSYVQMTGVDFLFFRFLTFGIILIMIVAGMMNLSMLYYIRKQKVYYKDIIDSAKNIILINNKHSIIDVNYVFFNYFKKYQTLENFKQNHKCICDFFEEDTGYLSKTMNGLNWVDYLVKSRAKSTIVKMNIEGEIYFFGVSASKISSNIKEDDIFSIVFADITEQENYKKELESISITDPLTGIGNRRFYQQKIKEEIAGIKRYNYDLSLIMCDIDFFKKINDTYGHDKGDKVLQEYTKLIDKRSRQGDIFCRIGGEEFIIILPHTNIKEAQFIAEKLRVLVENFQTEISVTMSFGVIECHCDEEIEILYGRVDKALYKAKKSGRNKVIVG